jgi:hypothetical protein
MLVDGAHVMRLDAGLGDQAPFGGVHRAQAHHADFLAWLSVPSVPPKWVEFNG